LTKIKELTFFAYWLSYIHDRISLKYATDFPVFFQGLRII